MNIKGRLVSLAMASNASRKAGKTTMIARAAKETGGTVLAANFEEARYIEKTFDVPARSVEINLEGFSGPFYFDNHAIEVLLLKAARKIEVLEGEIKELKEKLYITIEDNCHDD